MIYPHPPQNRRSEAKVFLKDLVGKHQVGVVAIGNGTACRETEELVAEIIAEGIQFSAGAPARSSRQRPRQAGSAPQRSGPREAGLAPQPAAAAGETCSHRRRAAGSDGRRCGRDDSSAGDGGRHERASNPAASPNPEESRTKMHAADHTGTLGPRSTENGPISRAGRRDSVSDSDSASENASLPRRPKRRSRCCRRSREDRRTPLARGGDEQRPASPPEDAGSTAVLDQSAGHVEERAGICRRLLPKRRHRAGSRPQTVGSERSAVSARRVRGGAGRAGGTGRRKPPRP